MKRFLLTFKGREVGGIGTFSDFRQVIDAPDEAAARIKIYATHEHLTGLKVHEISPATQKKYACERCGFKCEQETNHFGPTWSWGRFNTCPNCPPWAKYSEFGGSTVWKCLETEAAQS